MAIDWLNIAESGLSHAQNPGEAASPAIRWRRVARSWRAAAALVLLCLTVYLPGLWSIPPVDRDEARFAQASRQMFEAAVFPSAAPERVVTGFHDGGWAIPRIQNRERLNKPPLIYWLQVASAWLFTAGDPLDDAIWMYRVPSVLAAIATVLITWCLGRSMFDPRAAWLAAAILAVAPMIVWDAHQARADSVMMAFTTAAMWALWTIWKTRDSASCPRAARLAPRALFWLCLAAAIMTKGFIAPMVVGLAALFLASATRSWRWLSSLRPLLGVILIALPLVPWLYFVAQHKGGLGPYAQIVWDEFFVRGIAGSKEGHFWPPGFHTVLLAVLFWPGSLMTLAGFVRACKRARGAAPIDTHSRSRFVSTLRSWFTTPWTGRHAELFLIAWIVPAWIVFELSPAKLPHYTMPMLPAIALLSARMVMGAKERLGDVPLVTWAVIGILPLLLMGFYSLIALVGTASSPDFIHGTGIPIAAAVAGCCSLLSLIRIVRAYQARHDARAVQMHGIVAAAWLLIGGVGGVAPLDAPGASSPLFVAAARATDPTRSAALVSTEARDSLVFATRGRITFIQRDDAEDWIAAHPHSRILMPAPIRYHEEHSEILAQRGSEMHVRWFSGKMEHWLILGPRP
ncbi:MAG: ArnT family glycosyltransferase [Phycisphaerales bacterium]